MVRQYFALLSNKHVIVFYSSFLAAIFMENSISTTGRISFLFVGLVNSRTQGIFGDQSFYFSGTLFYCSRW
jgi:hypothetical protein